MHYDFSLLHLFKISGSSFHQKLGLQGRRDEAMQTTLSGYGFDPLSSLPAGAVG
jgi:hypothetical protein